MKQHSDLYVCNVFTHTPPIIDKAVEEQWIEALRPTFESFGAVPPVSLRNIYPSYNDSDAVLDVLLDLKPPIVSFHFGLPNDTTVRRLHEQGTVLMATATNLEEAVACEKAGLDVIIAQGSEAGGHRGCFDPSNDERLSTLPLVRMLKQHTQLPIVAAGGIMDGAGIRAALQLGADAVQMGTAFILCPESSADEGHRAAMRRAIQAYEQGKEARTIITTLISGRPARSLRNKFTDLGVTGAPAYPLTYDAGKLLHAAAKAHGEHGYGAHWAGQGVGMAREMPAKELMRVLVEEMRDQ
jgi:nitronate monooxygenase